MQPTLESTSLIITATSRRIESMLYLVQVSYWGDVSAAAAEGVAATIDGTAIATVAHGTVPLG